MGGAVLAGVLASIDKAKITGTLDEVPISSFIVSVHSKGSVDKLKADFSAYSETLTITQDNMEVFKAADILILGFKRR
jgi:hypothetical protein